MTYIITIENDMKQQLVFHAESVSGALDKAKRAFTESMVTALDCNGEFQHRPLSANPKVIHLALQRHTAYSEPTSKEIREKELDKFISDMPD